MAIKSITAVLPYICYSTPGVAYHDGWVKIGYSDNVQMRIKTLNNSGLPEPYHVYAIYKVKNRLEDLALHGKPLTVLREEMEKEHDF